MADHNRALSGLTGIFGQTQEFLGQKNGPFRSTKGPLRPTKDPLRSTRSSPTSQVHIHPRSSQVLSGRHVLTDLFASQAALCACRHESALGICVRVEWKTPFLESAKC